MAWPPILVRYGEIGIKSRNIRAQFERRLIQQIENHLLSRGIESELIREQGRFILRAEDVEGALDAARHTFGVVSASPAIETQPTPDAVANVALELARDKLPQGGSFAMRCKRIGEHAFTSLDVAKATAAAILDMLEERAPRVDLGKPDLELHSEVRHNTAFVFTTTVQGPGGLPMGSQGRTAILLDGPRAAHTAWLLAKRGSALLFVTTATDAGSVDEWLRPLRPWTGDVRLETVDVAPDATRGDLMEAIRPIVEKHNCHALALSDDAAAAIEHGLADKRLGHPVFRPLVGYHGERFRELARQAELPEDA